MLGDFPLDGGAHQSADRNRLADRPDRVSFGMDEDDEILDQSIEAIGFNADVLS